MKRILRIALRLVHVVIESVRLEGDSAIPAVRAHKRYQGRCPACGRVVPVYDAMPHPRKWRTLDLGGTKCYSESELRRVSCPVHGVRVEAVPWARHGSRFSGPFEDEVAWLSVHCCRSVVSELARIDWKSVGPICKRVHDDLEAEHGGSRFDGLRRISIDEASYKKGYKI